MDGGEEEDGPGLAGLRGGEELERGFVFGDAGGDGAVERRLHAVIADEGPEEIAACVEHVSYFEASAFAALSAACLASFFVAFFFRILFLRESMGMGCSSGMEAGG